MFQKLVAIEPVSLVPEAEKDLYQYAKEVVFYSDIPKSDEEIVTRIADADAVLVSYTSQIRANVLSQCPNVKYVGMCCSLYSEESANVDIAYARDHGIQVLGIRDYGDKGVVEYVICELVNLLHGYGKPMWQDEPVEITGLKVGVVGLGVSGRMIADALQMLGAEISYYARSKKEDAEAKGMVYRPLHELLAHCDVILTCLNKNVILLHDEEFEIMGNHKILFNTSIGVSFETDALKKWLEHGDNYFCCDTYGALGDTADGVLGQHPHVYCVNQSAGRTKQAFVLLSEKVLANIRTALESIQ